MSNCEALRLMLGTQVLNQGLFIILCRATHVSNGDVGWVQALKSNQDIGIVNI